MTNDYGQQYQAWALIPLVPAAGHVNSFGTWHPGLVSTCRQCHPSKKGTR